MGLQDDFLFFFEALNLLLTDGELVPCFHEFFFDVKFAQLFQVVHVSTLCMEVVSCVFQIGQHLFLSIFKRINLLVLLINGGLLHLKILTHFLVYVFLPFYFLFSANHLILQAFDLCVGVLLDEDGLYLFFLLF